METLKPVLAALQTKDVDHQPIWLMRQAGRYLPEYREIRKASKSFLDMCYEPSVAVKLTLQPVRRFRLDAAILFSDILVIPDALGQPVSFLVGKGPQLDPLIDADHIKQLNVANLPTHLSPVYESIRLLSLKLPSKTTLIGFAGAPWTVATYMIEGGPSSNFLRVKTWAYNDPVSFDRLIDVLTEATITHLSAQAKAGAEVLQLFDSWAGILPEEQFEKWVTKPTRDIVANIKSAFPNIPIIGFPRGAGVLYVNYASETNIDAVSLDTTVPLAWAVDNLAPRVALQGCLDPALLVTGGEAMRQATGKILDHFSSYGFVFNLGHGILPQTPPEHVDELVRLVQAWQK